MTETTEARACPICNGATELAYEVMYDDRYGFPGAYGVRVCRACGHFHLAARFSPDELGQLYTRYYPRASYNIDQHRVPAQPRGIRAWLRGDSCSAFYSVPRDVRVLDIGCGFCESLAYHKARGCEAHGVEADANARKIADAFGYNVHIGLFDPARYKPEYFDFVTLDQVIEHVADPRQFLAGVARVLKPGGTVLVSTPNAASVPRRLFGRRWIHWHVPYHLQVFSRQSMRTLAASAGLEVAAVRSITHSDWLYFQLMHLIAIPKCGVPHAFWAGQAWAGRRERRLAAFVAGLRRLRLHQIVTRMLDLLGVGDNQLFALHKPAAAATAPT